VKGGKVTEVIPLHKWLAQSCGKIAADALLNLGKLDGYYAGENNLQEFYFDVLQGRVTMHQSDMPAAVKTIPVALLKSEAGQYLEGYLW